LICLYIDGDACPVKDEVYAVAARYDLGVTIVANRPLYVPADLGVRLVVVDEGPDAADDWIVDDVRPHDVVVTADIPLAARCLELGAAVLGSSGSPFTDDMIHGALAMRELKSDLRGAGVMSGGPPGLTAKDRSRFASKLDEIVQRSVRDEAERHR
jgi:uncharacterized protein YaiI (UPF0178 family)